MSAVSSPRSRPLRVAQFIESLGMGGAEHLAVRIAGALATAGHDSHLIVATERGPLSDRVGPGVRVHYLGYERASITSPPAFLWSLGRGFSRLRDVVTSHGIETVQTHLPGANFWGLPLEWSRSCRTLATIHSNREFDYGAADARIRAALRRQAYRWLLRFGHGMIAVSDEVKTSLGRDLGLRAAALERIAVVRNGVPLPARSSQAEREQIRRSLDVGPGTALVLAAGRLCQQKNFGDLLDAFADVRRRGADARLLIAGDGPLMGELETQVRALNLGDVVHLPGNLANLGEVMAAADLLAMTSRWEGLPLVALEAMAAALPVVAYAIPGITELVEVGKTGLTCTVGDTASFSDCLVELIGEASTREAMGEAGRERVAERFSFDTTIDQLTALYRRAASDSH